MRPDRKICATCRHPLNAWEDSDGNIEYEHGIVGCNNVVPIDPDGGEILYSCDFCLAPDPIWTFRANEVIENSLSGTGDPFVSDEEWAACATCKPLIEAKDWRALWARNRHLKIVRENSPSDFHTARLAVLRLWLEFDRQRIGPPYLEQERVTPHDAFADAIKVLIEKETP